MRGTSLEKAGRLIRLENFQYLFVSAHSLHYRACKCRVLVLCELAPNVLGNGFVIVSLLTSVHCLQVQVATR